MQLQEDVQYTRIHGLINEVITHQSIENEWEYIK